MSTGTRILVLLTDGRDVGSRASLREPTWPPQCGSAVVYAISAGTRADRATLAALAGSTGGRLFEAQDVTQLSAIYAALGEELDRTWQLSYLARARPGDATRSHSARRVAEAAMRLRVPGSSSLGSSLIPASLAHRPLTAAIAVVLAALLLAAAGATVIRRRRAPQIRRLLSPHTARSDDRKEERDASRRLELLLAWTENAMADLPGTARLTRAVERAGTRLRIGHLPYLAVFSALLLAILGTAMVPAQGSGSCCCWPASSCRSSASGSPPDAGPRHSIGSCPMSWPRSRRPFAQGTACAPHCAPSRTTAARRRQWSSRASSAKSGWDGRWTRRSLRCASGSARRTSSTSPPRSTSSRRPEARWRRSSTPCRKPSASASVTPGRCAP